MAFIATTKALLDKEARQSVREEARLYLGTDNTLVCDLFQKGKWFIKETWTDPAMLAVKLKAAENEQLEAAIVENWQATSKLVFSFNSLVINRKEMEPNNNTLPGFAQAKKSKAGEVGHT